MIRTALLVASALLLVVSAPGRSVAVAATTTNRDLVEEGERLVQEGEVETALARFREAALARPDNVAAWMNAGFAAYCLDRLEEAEAFFDQVLARDPDNVYARRMKGHAAFGRGDLPGAIRRYEAVLALAPDDDASRDALEMARVRLGEIRGLAAARSRLDTWFLASLILAALIAAALISLTRPR